MKNTISIICVVFFALQLNAQNLDLCGYQYLDLIKKTSRVIDLGNQKKNMHRGMNADSLAIIPVVFHIALTELQLQNIGGVQRLPDIIDSQILYLNRDFAGRNSDSIKIPTAFFPLFGHSHVQFGLAHTNPYGLSTAGFEVKIITRENFSIDGIAGSTYAFSDVKYSYSDGLDAWDPTSYINIWVLSMRDNTVTSSILGLTMPADLTALLRIPQVENGICLSYRNWRNSFKGRTLTHEMGHYFNLKHIWGDDDGLCPDIGSDDDILDTPPQAEATYGCPNFPQFDSCSNSNLTSGIMYMNFMDYTNENCRQMFTTMQSELIDQQISLGASNYTLTLNNKILNYPDSSDTSPFYTIFPIPTKDHLFITFDKPLLDQVQFYLYDMTGKKVTIEYGLPSVRTYKLKLYNVSQGAYILQIVCSKMNLIRKIYIN